MDLKFIKIESLNGGIHLKPYLMKKNLFIFKENPEIFKIEDKFIIIGKEQNLKSLNIQDFDNIFTLFYTPIWIKSILSQEKINIIQLNDFGKVEKAILHTKFNRTFDIKEKIDIGYNLLQKKANTIDSIFKTSEAENLVEYSLKNKIDIYTINKNLNFIPKAIIMDTLKLKYKLTNKRAKEIVNTLFNLTENIVVYSLFNKFVQLNINPENSFLNTESPALIRDITEIQRIKFLKKLHYLFHSRFFDGRDLNRKHFPNTVVKFLKLLSTYFFYANRFKRLKEIFYQIESYKRGNYEIFSSLWYLRQ